MHIHIYAYVCVCLYLSIYLYETHHCRNPLESLSLPHPLRQARRGRRCKGEYCIYLSYQSLSLSLYLCIYPSIYLSIYPYLYPSIYLYLPIYSHICEYVYLYIYMMNETHHRRNPLEPLSVPHPIRQARRG